MARIYVPSEGAQSWQRLLADLKHWKTGYSARTLAHSWEATGGLPPEIASLFDPLGELLLAIPEHKVTLPGGGRESQNDVFALIRSGDEVVSVMIEGKVREAFGPTIAEWLQRASQGKTERLRYLCELLGLTNDLPGTIRYQLLHRTASAVIEAERFRTSGAAMVVQSFSKERLWFDDFAAFVALFGETAKPDEMISISLPGDLRLGLAWASGEPRFLMS